MVCFIDNKDNLSLVFKIVETIVYLDLDIFHHHKFIVTHSKQNVTAPME